MPSHPSSQISTDQKTEPDEPDHSSIDPGEKASTDAENDDEKSTKPLPDGGRDAWLNVLGTHLIYISTWGVYLLYFLEPHSKVPESHLTSLPFPPLPSPLADDANNNDNAGLITAYGALQKLAPSKFHRDRNCMAGDTPGGINKLQWESYREHFFDRGILFALCSSEGVFFVVFWYDDVEFG